MDAAQGERARDARAHHAGSDYGCRLKLIFGHFRYHINLPWSGPPAGYARIRAGIPVGAKNAASKGGIAGLKARSTFDWGRNPAVYFPM
jgi:hypothetical protein